MSAMKRTTVLAVLASALLGIAAQAQEGEGKARVGDVEGQGKVELRDESLDTGVKAAIDSESERIQYRNEAASRMGRVGNMNKASKVIGMEVKNPQGELLGEIQDVVVDLPSGRVSYVVLSVGGFLGFGEKYIAVPPSAFQENTGMDRLILNVDKSKVQAAQGFVKTQWPDLDNPAWGASAEWARDPAIDQPDDASGTLKIDRNRSDSQSDTELRIQNGQSERGAEKLSRHYETDRRYSDRSLAADSSEAFRGRIVSVNPEERTFTVSGDSGTRTFELADKPTLTLRGNRNAKLIDFRPGYSVSVGYHKEGDMWIAHSVIRTDPGESK